MKNGQIVKIMTIFLFLSLNVLGQINEDSIRQVVLTNNMVDSLYIFGEWYESGGTETQLKYLGVIESKAGGFKILTSCRFWGLSKRATSRILVFNKKNEFLGNYYVGMTYDLPEMIENNRIVFLHTKTDKCDKEVITRLSFQNGIPESFFLECKDGFGDVYTFEKNKN